MLGNIIASEPASPQTGANKEVSKLVDAEKSPWIPSKNAEFGLLLLNSRTTPSCLTGTDSEYFLDKQQDPLPVRTGTTTQADTNVSNLENNHCKHS